MQTDLAFLMGLTLGLAAAIPIVRVLVRSRTKISEAERSRAVEQLATAEDARDSALTREAEATSEVRKLTLAAVRTEGEHSKAVELLRVAVDTARREGADKLKLVTEATETMRVVLKDAAGEAFDGSGKKVVELTQAALKASAAENRTDFERERKNVEQLVTPMKDGLTKLGQAVDKLDRDRERQHAELGEQMRTVVSGQLQVRDEAAVLSRALTQPKAAGDWGEFHLRNLVEQAGMSEFCDFAVQASTADGDRLLRPDMQVNLPGKKLVVVDAKAPLAPFREACAADNREQRERLMKLFARGLKAHVKKLSAKQYADQFDSAPDFVVMYLPGDHFYSAAIEFEPSLIEEAVKHRVLIATPVSFIGLLRTIGYAWQQEKVADTARDIAHHGCTLYERLCVYLKHVDKVSRLVNSLADAQNAAIGSLERSVLPEARRFPELGAVGADKTLPTTRPVSGTARSLQAPEVIEHGAGRLPELDPAGAAFEEDSATSQRAPRDEIPPADPAQEAA